MEGEDEQNPEYPRKLKKSLTLRDLYDKLQRDSKKPSDENKRETTEEEQDELMREKVEIEEDMRSRSADEPKCPIPLVMEQSPSGDR